MECVARYFWNTQVAEFARRLPFATFSGKHAAAAQYFARCEACRQTPRIKVIQMKRRAS